MTQVSRSDAHKECFKCNRILPLEAFYAHPGMADGRLNKCKECNKRDVQVNYRLRHDQYKAYDLNRRDLPKRVAARKRVFEADKLRFPKRYKARNAVHNAVRDGKLERGPCERCGSLRVHGHHEDYSKPLDVMWLCPQCHKARHRELMDMGIEL